MSSTAIGLRVKLITIRDHLLPSSVESDQIFYPTTITPELKKEFPLGVVKMEEEVRQHFNKWINAVIAQIDPSVTNTIIVGCDNKFNRDETLSFYIELSE
jgi:hypothetical protein